MFVFTVLHNIYASVGNVMFHRLFRCQEQLTGIGRRAASSKADSMWTPSWVPASAKALRCRVTASGKKKKTQLTSETKREELVAGSTCTCFVASSSPVGKKTWKVDLPSPIWAGSHFLSAVPHLKSPFTKDASLSFSLRTPWMVASLALRSKIRSFPACLASSNLFGNHCT